MFFTDFVLGRWCRNMQPDERKQQEQNEKRCRAGPAARAGQRLTVRWYCNEAAMYAENSGCGAVGRLLNSGWN